MVSCLAGMILKEITRLARLCFEKDGCFLRHLIFETHSRLIMTIWNDSKHDLRFREQPPAHDWLLK